MDFNLIKRLEESLHHPLPGKKAQYEMAPASRDAHYEIPKSFKKASVLALMYPKPDDWHIVFIQRKSDDLRDRHAGQISLPGGKMEKQDSSLEECALREANEELGILPADVKILGRLSSLYVFVSGYLVHPFVGYSSYALSFKPQISEVEKVLEVSVPHILDPAIKKQKDLYVRDMLFKDIPYFDLHGHVLWGATAMIINELIQLMRKM